MDEFRPKSTLTDEELFARITLLAAPSRRKELRTITKFKKLIANLQGDLEKHGNSEQWKRYGDLILANIHNAVRHGGIISVIDYFDDATPTIQIEGEHQRTLNEIAESYFRRYTKARNGLSVIGERMKAAEAEVKAAELRLNKIDEAFETRDEGYLSSLIEPTKKKVILGKKKKVEAEYKGVRRFTSTDGFEILVGKKAKDNDFLTFRISRSLDTWMHAADYPGSHVIIRNPNRKPIPNQTLLEAAELAAFYSSGREQTKAAVNYTQRKFVNKPKRSAPGLVSLSSFKTLLVVPQVSIKLAE